MRKSSFSLLLCLAVLVFSLPARAAESAGDMLAAGRIDEAITVLHNRITAAPRDAQSLNLLCRAYFALEDWDRAESSCEKAVALEPGNSRYHLWLGRVQGEKADHTNFLSAARLAGRTRDEFQRAVELAPQDVTARVDLAEFYLEAPGIMGGGQDKAREQAKVIGASSPTWEHWVYARIAEKNKDAPTAEREYHRMIEASASDAESWLNLALFLRRQRRFDDMEQAIVRLSQAPLSKPDVLVEGAQSLYRTGRNFPLAIQLLERYLASGPVEEAPAFKAHYLLGSLLEKQGDKTGAVQHYRASLALAGNFGLAQEALNRVAR